MLQAPELLTSFHFEFLHFRHHFRHQNSITFDKNMTRDELRYCSCALNSYYSGSFLDRVSFISFEKPVTLVLMGGGGGGVFDPDSSKEGGLRLRLQSRKLSEGDHRKPPSAHLPAWLIHGAMVGLSEVCNRVATCPHALL